jgi:hypothetical protein
MFGGISIQINLMYIHGGVTGLELGEIMFDGELITL